MITVRHPYCLAGAIALAAAAAALPAIEAEKQQINGKGISVSNSQELKFGVRKGDADVQSRELWYRSAAMGKQKWQKHSRLHWRYRSGMEAN